MRNRRYKYSAMVAVLLLVFTTTAPAAAVWVDDDLEPHFGRPSITSPQELSTTSRQVLKTALRQETNPNSQAVIAAVARQEAAPPSATSDAQRKRIGEHVGVKLDELRRVAGFREFGSDLDDVMTIICLGATVNSCNKQVGSPRFAPPERGFM